MKEILGEIGVLTMREIRKWLRSPFLMFFTLVQPIIWMGLFGKAFNITGFIRIPDEMLQNLPPYVTSQLAEIFNNMMTRLFGTADIDYFSYIAVGMLSITILFSSMSSGMGIAWDRRLGFLNKLLAAPIWRGSIIVSKVLSGVLRAVMQAALLLLVALAFGARFHVLFPLGPLAAFGALFFLALGLTSLFIALGLRLKSWESQAAVMNLLNLPLMFASNALYPIALMPTWLQAIAQANPISYAVDAVRQSFILGSAANTAALLTDLTVTTGFGIGLLMLSAYLAGTALQKN